MIDDVKQQSFIRVASSKSMKQKLTSLTLFIVVVLMFAEYRNWTNLNTTLRKYLPTDPILIFKYKHSGKPKPIQNETFIPFTPATNISLCSNKFNNPSSVSNISTWNTTHHKLVFDHYLGRLGNQMFEYASVYGLAVKHNRQPLVPAGDLHRYFHVSAEVVSKDLLHQLRSNKNTKQVRKVREQSTHCCRLQKEILCQEKAENVDTFYLTQGFLQSFRYFDSSWLDIVEKEFRFLDKIEQPCQKRWAIATKVAQFNRTQQSGSANISEIVPPLNDREHILLSNNGCIFVGIHVRRGDYVANRKGYIPADANYVRNAMQWFRNRYH